MFDLQWFANFAFSLSALLSTSKRETKGLMAASCLQCTQVATVLMKHILRRICADRLLPCHLRNRNPPDFISRDQHQGKVAAILLGVKARRGVGHPLDRLLFVVQCPRFDLNRVDRSAPFSTRSKAGAAKMGTETEKPSEAKAWAAIASAVCPISCLEVTQFTA